ncbi:MAG: calcium/sodium antiporter [Planctomycetota bacterium]
MPALDALTIILMLVGFPVLIIGADVLVRGASAISRALGISPLVVGLTVVSFGTSAPELAVSVKAAADEKGSLALGNVIGSNIFNVLLILGLCAVIRPMRVKLPIVRRDVPLMIIMAFAVWVMGLNGLISTWDGLILVAVLAAYLLRLYIQARRGKFEVAADEDIPEAPKTFAQVALNIGLVALGVLMLVVSANMLVNGAVAIAEYFKISELIIGLTIIAAGTSLPEVAASGMAAFKKQGDLAVGNVVGSNLFNIMAVLGITSVVDPQGIRVPTEALYFDIPVMVAVMVACFPVFFTGFKITRFEGSIFLFYFVAYMLFLVLDAQQHDALQTYTLVLSTVVIPLTVIALTALMVNSIRRQYRRKRLAKMARQVKVARDLLRVDA